MGISDKDYADAIIQKQKKAQQKQTVEQMIKGIEAVAGSITLSTTNYPTTGKLEIVQPYGQFKALTEKDLGHEGMKAPLSALIDMWTVRWGSEWVGEVNFQEDDFWRIALVRLTGANKLEKHNLANQYMSVYRIIE
jgi:hypothetical protein